MEQMVLDFEKKAHDNQIHVLSVRVEEYVVDLEIIYRLSQG